MAKLGYTWYPKDWGNSENVFELSLAERGLYRELIDLAMMNDNTTEIKHDVWCRKFAVSSDELTKLLLKLQELNLVSCSEKTLFIPSCEPRLNLKRGGSSGGKNKPTTKPTPKPDSKPTLKQREREREREYKSKSEEEREKGFKEKSKNQNFSKELLTEESWIEVICMQNKITPDQVPKWIEMFNGKLQAELDTKTSKQDFASHFSRWLPGELLKTKQNDRSNKPTFSTNR